MKYIPEWFPWVEFHRVAKEARKVSHALRFDLYESTKKKIVRARLQPFILLLMLILQSEGSVKESMTTIFLAESTREDGFRDRRSRFLCSNCDVVFSVRPCEIMCRICLEFIS